MEISALLSMGDNNVLLLFATICITGSCRSALFASSLAAICHKHTLFQLIYFGVLSVVVEQHDWVMSRNCRTVFFVWLRCRKAPEMVTGKASRQWNERWPGSTWVDGGRERRRGEFKCVCAGAVDSISTYEGTMSIPSSLNERCTVAI